MPCGAQAPDEAIKRYEPQRPFGPMRHKTASRSGRPVLEVVGGRTQARAVVGMGVLTHMGLENIFSLVWVSTDFSLRQFVAQRPNSLLTKELGQ